MPIHANRIISLVGSAPVDLLAYHREQKYPAYFDSRINCLPLDEAERYTRDLLKISVAERLGLWILDDANDSNPFAYISKGPCSGMIVRYSHDDDSKISFSSLANFLTAITQAGETGIDIDEIESEQISLSLGPVLDELVHEGTDDAIFLLTLYLSISGPLGSSIKDSLASHQDLHIREAFANTLVRMPFPEDVAIAEQLANDKHPQVVRRGKAAVAAIRKVCFNKRSSPHG